MRAFDRYYEQFFDGGVFSDVADLYSEETNNIYNQNEKNLIYLLYKKGHQNMGEIASRIHLPKSTASFVVNKLVKMGILENRRNKADKRVKEVILTESGLEEASKIAENLNARFEKLLSNAISRLNKKISEDEMQTVRKALNIILG